MDKNAIKKFAIWARKELIARVTQRAYLYGVDGEQELDAEQKEVNGRLLSAVERRQRRTLVNRVNEKGFESVMDEAAYTWFNRFAALRYMEVNGVLPTRVRVFTDNEGAFQPQILTECLTMDNLEAQQGNRLRTQGAGCDGRALQVPAHHAVQCPRHHPARDVRAD